MKRLFSAIAVFVMCIASIVLTSTAAKAATVGPETDSFLGAYAFSQTDPSLQPVGSNDWSCKPTAERPRPVILAHGTWENQYADWAKIAPELKRTGYCVFSLNYGKSNDNLTSLPPAVFGTADIRNSAREFGTFVDKVLGATGASQVDVVGHSQGGMMPRQYMKFEGGSTKIKNLVALSPSNHGTTHLGLAKYIRMLAPTGIPQLITGKAAEQQADGSSFIPELNAGGDTTPGVNYTVIVTQKDQVVTPYTRSFLEAGPGATVNNITLQNGCSIDNSDHMNISYSPRAIYFVQKGLDPNYRNGTQDTAPCTFRAPTL